MHRTTRLSLIALAFAASATGAYAAMGKQENDAMAIGKAKFSLAQAVTIAEQSARGKAVRAEYENTKQGWAFDVEVVSGAKVFDVRIDAGRGTVLSSTEDKMDNDDDKDKPD